MKKNRPIHLDITKIHFPLNAIASILHRVSGVIVFVLLPLFLWLLQTSLHSEASFDGLQTGTIYAFLKFLLWGGLSALTYHLLAGIRHLLMDIGYAPESLEGSQRTAQILIALSIVLIILLGVWIW